MATISYENVHVKVEKEQPMATISTRSLETESTRIPDISIHDTQQIYKYIDFKSLLSYVSSQPKTL